MRLWVPEALETRLSASNWSGDLLAGVHGTAVALAIGAMAYAGVLGAAERLARREPMRDAIGAAG